MEAETPRIQELIDLVVEKLFTVSLLAGHDADSEFEKGLMAVEKAAQVLLGTSLDPDYLAAGLTQLVEQRLPDQRVIENFPQFPWLMKQMIGEGSQAVLAKNGEGNKVADPESIAEQASARVVLLGGRTPVVANDNTGGRIALRPHLMHQISTVASQGATSSLNPENVQAEEVLSYRLEPPAGSETEVYSSLSSNSLTLVKPLAENEREETGSTDDTGSTAATNSMAVMGATAVTSEASAGQPIILAPTTVKEVEPKTATAVMAVDSGVKPTSQGAESKQNVVRGITHPGGPPKEAAQLNYVLKREFPKSVIRWNLLLGGICFLAQVENLLIYLRKEGEDYVPQLGNEGWHIVSLTSEDLVFPRRIERFIHFNRFSGF